MSVRRRQSELKETLTEFYSELDRKWEEAEDLLLSFQVPEAVTVPVKTVAPTEAEQPFVPRSEHQIGYVRHFGRWALCYGVTAADKPEEVFWLSIHSCSAEQKVEAAPAFPTLLEKVLAAAEVYSESVLDAVSLLDLSLAADDVADGEAEDITEGAISEERDTAAETASLESTEGEIAPETAASETVESVDADAEPIESDDLSATETADPIAEGEASGDEDDDSELKDVA